MGSTKGQKCINRENKIKKVFPDFEFIRIREKEFKEGDIK